jgi:hypothetical protein
MSNLAGFNANEVPESTYGAMPIGLYQVMATESEVKPTKAGTGQYLQFVIDVLDEKYNTKKLWARLNLWNPNPTAVQIAQQELGALCRAVGVITPDDSSQLCGIPFIVRLGIEKDNKGGEQNTILNYYSIAAGVELAAKEAAEKPANNPAAKPAAAAAAKAGGPVWPGAPR